MKTWALSIQQKFRLDILKFHVPSGTIHSGYTDPTQATARLVIVLVSRIQKSGTGDNNFVKWKGTFRSYRPTEMTRPVKVDHLKRWSQIFRSERTEMVRSIWFLTENSGILSWMKSAQWYDFKGEIQMGLTYWQPYSMCTWQIKIYCTLTFKGTSRKKGWGFLKKKPVCNLCNLCKLQASFKFKKSIDKKARKARKSLPAKHDFCARWKRPSICWLCLPEEQVSNPIQKSSCTPSRSEKQWPVRRYRCCEAQRWSYIEVTLEFGLHLLKWVFCYRLIRCLDSLSRWHLLAHPAQSRYALLRNKNQEERKSKSRKTTVGWFGLRFNEQDGDVAFSLFNQLLVVN